MRRIALLAALCALTPSVAHAQLYSWHDATGRLVISDRKIDPSAQTYSMAVGSAFAVVTTKQSLNVLVQLAASMRAPQGGTRVRSEPASNQIRADGAWA